MNSILPSAAVVCTTFKQRLSSVFLFAALLSGFIYAPGAVAQDRVFPENSKRGLLFLPIGAEKAKIDGTIYPLAVAVQFRDRENFLVFAEDYQYVVGTAVVRYTTTLDNELYQVWFLTKAEAEAAEPGLSPKLPDLPDAKEDEEKAIEKPEDVLDPDKAGKSDSQKPKTPPPAAGSRASGTASGGGKRPQ